jgi:hypothetical protein
MLADSCVFCRASLSNITKSSLGFFTGIRLFSSYFIVILLELEDGFCCNKPSPGEKCMFSE